MAQYKLHCFCQSGNSYKVALYLNCAGLDWEPVFVDFFKGATRDPKWRESVNEQGEAPVLETGGKKLTQSGAILLYLAEMTDKFAPQDDDERNEALRWILFDNHKFTSYFATYRFLKSFAPAAPDPKVLEFLKGRFDAALAIVEKHLARPSSWWETGRPSPTSRLPATCSTRRRRAATTGRRPIPISPPGSSACARCRAGRTPTR